MRCSKNLSLDHLVGELLKIDRHIEAKCFGGFEVDQKFKLGGLFNRDVARLGAFEDFVRIDSRAARLLDIVRSMTSCCAPPPRLQRLQKRTTLGYSIIYFVGCTGQIAWVGAAIVSFIVPCFLSALIPA